MDAKTMLQIDKIAVGNRVRRDMGDLKSLASSMERHGLLHPVVVKSDRTLIAGHRRIEAARLLGWSEIPVTIIDVADLLSAERDENAERKAFTPTEAVAIGRLIEEQHREKIAAQVNQQRIEASKVAVARRAGIDLPQRQVAALGLTRHIASAAVGMGHTSYIQAKQVVAAAETMPGVFGDLPAMMDELAVGRAHREMNRRKLNGGHRNPALHKMAHLKPNREVERAVHSLSGVCHVLEELRVGDLDADKRPEWAKALKKSASIIQRVARRINGER